MIHRATLWPRHPKTNQSQSSHFKLLSLLLALLIPLCFVEADIAKAEQLTMDDLAEMDLEDLANLMITSVSKTSTKLTESPAAVYVVTSEDIRRSGATSIPEALRMVPGLQVAQVGAASYAITSRGFNFLFQDKLLVLMDGRSVYTPTFGGVYWDSQDTMMEDIDRIEVIRGPGATLWGANAVNGVINIITKSTEDTQGGKVTAGTGSEERGFSSMRYGGKFGIREEGDASFRIFAKYNQHDDLVTENGSSGHDEYDAERGGFRIEWNASERDQLRLQGDIYTGDFNTPTSQIDGWMAMGPTTVYGRSRIGGGNLLASWSRTLSDDSDFTLQAYYDRTQRNTEILDVDRHTYDLDFQHRFRLNDWNQVIWGLGYRLTDDHMDGTFAFSFEPSGRRDHLYSGFLQNESSFFDDMLRLTLGTKIERNDYTGFEFQPNARLVFLPHEDHSLWASVSRAVQTSSRRENLILRQHADAGPWVVSEARGYEDVSAARLYAYEIGYRTTIKEKLSIDLAAFYNNYTHLVSFEQGLGFPSPSGGWIVDVEIGDRLRAHTRGAELAAEWEVLDCWRLKGSYTYTYMNQDASSTMGDVTDEEQEVPRNQFSIRSYADLPFNLQWDTMLYYVDHVSGNGKNVSPYFRLDLRLAWKPCDDLELSVVGQNLTDKHHTEWGPRFGFDASEPQRSFYVKADWNF